MVYAGFFCVVYVAPGLTVVFMPFSYFLCYEDIRNVYTDANSKCHYNTVRTWSIGQWVQVNPDPNTEDIYDWYADSHLYTHFSIHLCYLDVFLYSVLSGEWNDSKWWCVLVLNFHFSQCVHMCLFQDHVWGSSGQLSQAVVSGQRWAIPLQRDKLTAAAFVVADNGVMLHSAGECVFVHIVQHTSYKQKIHTLL